MWTTNEIAKTWPQESKNHRVKNGVLNFYSGPTDVACQNAGNHVSSS
ncbi:MAG: hypothetical protein ACJA04_000495 [Cellvibrionaceae bacterium]|jgi:hypothetical protein